MSGLCSWIAPWVVRSEISAERRTSSSPSGPAATLQPHTAVQGNPSGAPDPAVIVSLVEFGSYLRDLRAEKLRHPADDLTSGLVQAA